MITDVDEFRGTHPFESKTLDRKSHALGGLREDHRKTPPACKQTNTVSRPGSNR
jgi:hypothetical protein